MKEIEKRKQQHILLAQDENSQGNSDPFANYSLPYKALPEINLSDVDTSCFLLDKKLSQPLIIASMTGGTAHAGILNKNLAIAAEELKIAIGVGSQRITLEIKEAEDSFKIVRKYAPKTVIFANMAAVQLNYGYGLDHYRKIVDMISADGLYLHLNPLQEAIQPEGDTNFSGLLEKISDLVKKIDIPVFVKEVGHGLDVETCKNLIDIGIKGVDIAGVGGTSWAWIEAQRKNSPEFAQWFKNFGLPTDQVLREIAKIKKDAKLIASGGIRNPIQGLKAHLLGADYYSAAYPFLQPALESPESLIDLISAWQKGLQIAMFGISAENRSDTKKLSLTKIA